MRSVVIVSKKAKSRLEGFQCLSCGLIYLHFTRKALLAIHKCPDEERRVPLFAGKQKGAP